jgi:hypothetical protein
MGLLNQFVGLLRTTLHKGKDGKKVNVVNIGKVHEYGKWIAVTEEMRSYLHGHGMHLSADTKLIRIPPRPVIGPVWEKEKAGVALRLANSMKDPLRVL